MSTPVEPEFLPFTRPSISEEAIAEVVDCLRSGWITTGPRTARFEQMLQAYTGAPHAQACISATAGLMMALMALDLEEGDEVITTTLTFVATLNTIVQAGGSPVLVDIDPGTYNLDLAAVEAAITPRTRAIVPVHYAGLPVDLDALYAIAARHNLRVIEDAAHAIGAEYKGRKIGSFGDTQVFSFHPNKNMTTGEGGCITTRDTAMVDRVNKLRFHGIDREAFNRFAKSGSQHYDIALAGYKFNFMDIQAALGIHQLPALDGFNARRAALVDTYYEAIGAWEQLQLPQVRALPYAHKHTWHLFTPTVNTGAAGCNRDELMSCLKAEGIGSGLHWDAPHLSTYYRERWGYRPGQFPVAERVAGSILSLPLFPDMTEAQQQRVIRALGKAVGRTA